jgi:class 3 adenylate cyclase/predicted ATPase
VDTAAWLKQLGLEQYEAAFRDNAIDFALLPDLTAEDLKEIGVTALGHRKRLLASIAAFSESNSPAAGELAALPIPVPGRRDAERRQLTVMFVDLVGSTKLAGKLDPEEMQEVLKAYQNTTAGEITRFEGHVAKFMGDGVLAYFGWPQAHEDDAERAVRAGLAVTEAVAALPAREGQPLSARVGIATGLVVVGDFIGSGSSQEEAVVGDTPNLAARLQTLAEPGAVVVSELTHRLLGRLFEMIESPPQILRGFEGPVKAFHVVGEGGAESRFEALQAVSNVPPFAGRKLELELLLDRWRLAVSGQGQVVQIVGEPGIGKSRLLQELRASLAGERHTRLSYACSPYHTQSALYPIAEQMARAAGIARKDPPERKLALLEDVLALGTDRLDEAVPLVAALLSIPTQGRYPDLDLTPQKQKARTFEILSDQLEGFARSGSVLMLLEDAHLLDPTSTELFDLVVERITHLPVMLVAASRPDGAARWSGHAHATLLTLNRLDRTQAASVINGMTGGRRLPSSVFEQILEKTDGVPLFVEELTKVVLESGLLREKEGGFALTGPLAPFSIPATLQDSLMARLDRLAPVRELAQVGAVIGREFSYELLRAVTGRSDAELDDAAEQLVDSGLVFRRGAGQRATFVFKHALVQEAAYNSLLISRRRQLHARIAQETEECFPEIATSEPELLARHFEAADLVNKAVSYHEKAGRSALARSALTEALAHFGRALDGLARLPRTQERLRCELSIQLALGSSHVAANGFAAEPTGEAYRRARILCEEIGETRELFPVLYGLCLYHLYGAELVQAEAAAERLLSLAESTNDRSLRFFAHRAAGVTSLPSGKFLLARGHLEQALELYDPEVHRAPAFIYAFDPRVVCLDYLARTLLPLGYPERALAVNDDAVAEARRTSHRNSLALPLFFGGVIRQILGDRSGVRERYEELDRIAGEAGFRFWEAGARILRGWALADAGELEAGRAELRRGAQDWQASGAEYMVPYFLALEAQIDIKAGDGRTALHLLAEASAKVEQTNERWFAAEILRLQGEVLVAMGSDQAIDAESCFARALDTAESQQARLWELRAALSLSRLGGEGGHARERVRRLSSGFEEGHALPDLQAAHMLSLR